MVATDDLAWLQKDHQWPGMRSVAKVESRRELLVEGKVEEETRYYISSLPGDAKQIGHAVRSHWGVENGLHWVMDMVFRATSAAYEARTRRPTSPPSSTWPAICCVAARANTACAPVVTSLVGRGLSLLTAHHLSNPTQSICPACQPAHGGVGGVGSFMPAPGADSQRPPDPGADLAGSAPAALSPHSSRGILQRSQRCAVLEWPLPPVLLGA